MQLSYLLAISAVSLITVAEELRKIEYCFDAVYEAFGDLTFVGNTADEYWESTCQNPLKLTSIYASAKTYCTDHEIHAGTLLLAHYCMEYGEVELVPMSKFAENLTKDFIKSMRVVNYGDIPETENITVPILLSGEYYGASHRTVVGRLSIIYTKCL